MFIALFVIVKTLTIDRGMDKEDVVYIYIYKGKLLSKKKKKNEIMTFVATWMNLKNVILSEVKSER